MVEKKHYTGVIIHDFLGDTHVENHVVVRQEFTLSDIDRAIYKYGQTLKKIDEAKQKNEEKIS